MSESLFDYIIVGAGAAGSVLAARLAESGKNKILLIEAGPNNVENPLITNPSSFLYLLDIGQEPSPSHLGFQTVPQLGKVYTYPRGTGLGGSTNHHAMVDGRGSHKIFDQWVKLTHSDLWSYKNIFPFYKKMESYRGNDSVDARYHGEKGWLQITHSKSKEIFFSDLIKTVKEELNVPWREDFNIPGHAAGIGFTDAQVSTNGRRSNAATDLLLPAIERCQKNGSNHLTLLTNTLTTKIIFSKKKAIGVETIHSPHAFKMDASHKETFSEDKKITYLSSKEVILCCGAINTPQLLLLSGIGPKEHLSAMGVACIHDSPGVGAQILDHTEVALVHHVQNLPGKVWPWQAYSLAQKDPKYRAYVDKTASTENQIPYIFDWHSGYTQSDPDFPDLHIHLCKFYFRDFNLNRDKNRYEDPLKGSYLDMIMTQLDSENPRAYHTSLIEVMTNESHGSGSIRLKSNQPTDPPEIDLKLYENEGEITRLALGIQLMRKIFGTQTMQRYVVDECLPGPDYQSLHALIDYIRRYSSFGHHIGGTAKMGAAHDPFAVVDAALKVNGVEGLRICDASIFPVLPSYNPSRTVYLIAEVLSSLLT